MAFYDGLINEAHELEQRVRGGVETELGSLIQLTTSIRSTSRFSPTAGRKLQRMTSI